MAAKKRLGEELVEPPPAAYLCSISQRGRFRRLHFAGSCWRVPGTHFLHWEDLGSGEPVSVLEMVQAMSKAADNIH